MNIVKFPEPAEVVRDEDTIERLKELLEMAERGEVVGIGFVTLLPNGGAGMGWTNGCTENRLAAIGAVSCLSAAMHRTLVEI